MHLPTIIKPSLYSISGLCSCLAIHTFAKDSERAKACVSTLCKYLDNILNNPTEEKFRKIKKTNKVYLEKVRISSVQRG